jgi:hypothetical protein
MLFTVTDLKATPPVTNARLEASLWLSSASGLCGIIAFPKVTDLSSRDSGFRWLCNISFFEVGIRFGLLKTEL